MLCGLPAPCLYLALHIAFVLGRWERGAPSRARACLCFPSTAQRARQALQGVNRAGLAGLTGHQRMEVQGIKYIRSVGWGGRGGHWQFCPPGCSHLEAKVTLGSF